MMNPKVAPQTQRDEDLLDELMEHRRRRLEEAASKEKTELRPDTQPVVSEKTIQDNSRKLWDLNYPGQNCLKPADISIYAETGTLSETNREHLANCAGCCALIAGARIPDDVLDKLREEVLGQLSEIA